MARSGDRRRWIPCQLPLPAVLMSDAGSHSFRRIVQCLVPAGDFHSVLHRTYAHRYPQAVRDFSQLGRSVGGRVNRQLILLDLTRATTSSLTPLRASLAGAELQRKCTAKDPEFREKLTSKGDLESTDGCELVHRSGTGIVSRETASMGKCRWVQPPPTEQRHRLRSVPCHGRHPQSNPQSYPQQYPPPCPLSS